MSYKWKPSAAQRKAFAEKMKDPTEQAAYLERKQTKKEHNRQSSVFEYDTAGGKYIPTKQQQQFAGENFSLFTTPEEKTAASIVIGGYACNERVHHDYIHIVNEKMRISGL